MSAPPVPRRGTRRAPHAAHSGSDLPAAARRYPLTLVLAVLLLTMLMVVSLGIGVVYLSPGEVVAALVGDPVVPFHSHIVVGLRLPRILIAAVAGGMLALAGGLLQAATRNPLAEPSLLGISSGAALALVATLVVTGRDVLSGPVAGAAALAGAFGAGTLVYVLSWSRRVGTVRLVLDGVLISAILSSLVSVLLLLDGSLFPVVLRWVIGSLNGRVWQDWALLWPWALVAVPLGLLVIRQASLLWLGDDVAAATGMDVGRSRLLLFSGAILLTAGAVAAVGAIGFVGLLAPHIARMVVGSHPRRALPLAALVGAALLVSADMAAESLTTLWPLEVQNRATLPAGAVTAIVGGPALLALIWRRRGA